MSSEAPFGDGARPQYQSTGLDALLREFFIHLRSVVAKEVALQLPSSIGDREFLTVREAADLMCAKPQRIYDLTSAGVLTRHKDGARLLLSRDEILQYLRNR